jgi:hypothetical protein
MLRRAFRFLLLVGPLSAALHAELKITSNGVTWTLAETRQSGVFVNGDPWVLGPVTVTSITNSLNDPAFTPKLGQNGSMLNPGTDARQGYESSLRNYDASLNVALRDGRPVSSKNPLPLPTGSTLVSAVSWLYRSETEAEPGCPRFDGATRTPRPDLRAAGILTVLAEAPPADAFRPAYVGSEKTIRFRTSALDYSKLPSLTLPAEASAPAFSTLADAFAKTWLDHVNGWLGGHLHPSDHMPNYGRDMGRLVGDATLRLFTDASPRGKNPDKDRLIIGLVQYGIDSAGIADNDGGWPADGGHGLGRKWPILLAGSLLNNAHLLNAGRWPTRFQENEQTFYVSRAEVAITNGPEWKPDKRATLLPYTDADIGKAEWGIRHATVPQSDNAHFTATYREINGAIMPAFALAARAMGLKQAWNHDPFFDYCDRYMTWRLAEPPTHNRPSGFLVAMWDAHRPKLP